jgi:hypothetical protein
VDGSISYLYPLSPPCPCLCPCYGDRLWTWLKVMWLPSGTHLEASLLHPFFLPPSLPPLPSRHMQQVPPGAFVFNLGSGRGSSVLELIRAMEQAYSSQPFTPYDIPPLSYPPLSLIPPLSRHVATLFPMKWGRAERGISLCAMPMPPWPRAPSTGPAPDHSKMHVPVTSLIPLLPPS